MITSALPQKISIHITTYKPYWTQKNHKMDEGNKKVKPNTYVCAICLNSKSNGKNNENNKRFNKSCPICQKNCNYCQNTKQKSTKDELNPNAKNVQTSETNVAQGLNLLNEVLTVFQNKKTDTNKDKAKSGVFKDAAVSTEDFIKKGQTRLTISTFHYSIDETKQPEDGKFTVVNSCQPDFIKNKNSMHLIYHKSSSVPQMKMEELKHSLKEKTKSKDAIEEVNRMFATIRKASKNIENNNRPTVRHGPRVLPVVKNLVRQDMRNVNVESEEKICESCKCCQTCMSSGDSFKRMECCHERENDKCDVYTMCCHYPTKKKTKKVCGYCKTWKEEPYGEHENCDDD